MMGVAPPAIAANSARPWQRSNMTQLVELVAVSREVAATRSRSKKIAAIAGALEALAPEEIAPVVGFLCGEPRQGRLGLGYVAFRELVTLQSPTQFSVTALELDAAFEALVQQFGKGA